MRKVTISLLFEYKQLSYSPNFLKFCKSVFCWKYKIRFEDGPYLWHSSINKGILLILIFAHRNICVICFRSKTWKYLLILGTSSQKKYNSESMWDYSFLFPSVKLKYIYPQFLVTYLTPTHLCSNKGYILNNRNS